MNHHQKRHPANQHLVVQILYAVQLVIRPSVHACQDTLALHRTVDRSASQTANAALTEHVLTINVPILVLEHVDQMQIVESSVTHLNAFAEVDTGVIRLINVSQSEVSKIKRVYNHAQINI